MFVLCSSPCYFLPKENDRLTIGDSVMKDQGLALAPTPDFEKYFFITPKVFCPSLTFSVAFCLSSTFERADLML